MHRWISPPRSSVLWLSASLISWQIDWFPDSSCCLLPWHPIRSKSLQFNLKIIQLLSGRTGQEVLSQPHPSVCLMCTSTCLVSCCWLLFLLLLIRSCCDSDLIAVWYFLSIYKRIFRWYFKAPPLPLPPVCRRDALIWYRPRYWIYVDLVLDNGAHPWCRSIHSNSGFVKCAILRFSNTCSMLQDSKQLQG